MGMLDDVISSLSGVNRYSMGPSSSNSLPDQQDTSAPQQPSISMPQTQAPTQPSAPQTPQLGPQAQGVKGYLANIFYQMGESAKKHVGLPTEFEIQQQQQKMNLAQQQFQTETDFKNRELQQKMQMVTLPNGMQVPFALAKPFLDSQAKVQVANIGAQAKLTSTLIGKRYIPVSGVGMFDTQPQSGGEPQLVPGSSPTGVTVTYDIAKEYGIPKQLIGKTIPIQQFSGLLRGQSQFTPTVTNTTETKELGDGTLVQIPKTTTSQKIPSGAPQAAPNSPAAQSGPKAPVSMNTRGGVKTLVGPDGQPLQGKTSADTGFAFDPKTGERVEATRAEASQQGLQNFTKWTSAQYENARQLNNRVADVAQKINVYQDSFNQPINETDRTKLSELTADDKFKAEFLGASLPVDWMNKLAQGHFLDQLSPAAKNRLFAYFNAEEAQQGYNRVLSGSGRGNEFALKMILRTLPSPIAQQTDANMAIGQFKQNLPVAVQGLPKMKGIKSVQDIENEFQQQRQQQSEPPRPANVPSGYVFKENGPKGRGWYRP